MLDVSVDGRRIISNDRSQHSIEVGGVPLEPFLLARGQMSRIGVVVMKQRACPEDCRTYRDRAYGRAGISAAPMRFGAAVRRSRRRLRRLRGMWADVDCG